MKANRQLSPSPLPARIAFKPEGRLYRAGGPTSNFQLQGASQSGGLDPRALSAFALCSASVFLAMLGFAANPPGNLAGSQSEQPGAAQLLAQPSAPLETATPQWSIVVSPNIGAADVLRDVACTSESDCWAVGYYYNGTVYQTLIEHWNGIAWSVWTSPNTPKLNNYLNAVACAGASKCWAVGSDSKQTLIEEWDGVLKTWSIVSSPSPDLAVLNDVTCTDADNCWAVGGRFLSTSTGGVTSITSEPLIKHWHDGLWTDESANAPGIILTGVACVDASNCSAIGNYTRIETTPSLPDPVPSCGVVGCILPDCIFPFISTCDTLDRIIHDEVKGVTTSHTVSLTNAMLARWDGKSWSLSPPAIAPPDSPLLGLTCAPTGQLPVLSECWAVGTLNANGAHTLIEEWNGAAWTIVPSANSSATQNNYLQAVTCTSATDCWAVGKYQPNAYETLTEHWDGTQWSMVSSPNTTASFANVLNAVTCVSASDCWAAGYYGNGSNYRTLIEHYAVPPPTLVSVVSRKDHNGAGTFDVDFPLTGNPGVECRTGGTNNDYQMVMTFANAVTFNSAAVTSGTGTISSTSGSDTTVLTVNLTGITNAQTITLTLFGVNDGTNTGDVGVRMGVLVGDVNGNGVVSNTDVASVKAQVAAAVTTSNFRNDVNANGVISNTDVSLTKAQVGATLP
jgi:hypothetical protein